MASLKGMKFTSGGLEYTVVSERVDFVIDDHVNGKRTCTVSCMLEADIPKQEDPTELARRNREAAARRRRQNEEQ